MGKGKAIAGMVIGIISVIFGFMGGLMSLLAFPLSIVGLVISIKGGNQLREAGEPVGIATAGLVLGVIATTFTGITFFTCGLCTLCALGAAGSTAAGLSELAGLF